jgi:hypothetical protein
LAALFSFIPGFIEARKPKTGIGRFTGSVTKVMEGVATMSIKIDAEIGSAA